MKRLRTAREAIAFLFGGLAVVASLGSSTAMGNSLTEKSPFMPPQSAMTAPSPQAVNPQAQNLAFRGVYSIGDKRFYNIFNKQLNKGTWVSENDPSADYKVLHFDESSNSVRLKVEGSEQELALDRPNWVSIPVQGTPPPVMAGTGTPGRPGVPTRPPPPRRRVVSPNRAPPQGPPPGPPGSPAYNAWANANQSGGSASGGPAGQQQISTPSGVPELPNGGQAPVIPPHIQELINKGRPDISTPPQAKP